MKPLAESFMGTAWIVRAIAQASQAARASLPSAQKASKRPATPMFGWTQLRSSPSSSLAHPSAASDPLTQPTTRDGAAAARRSLARSDEDRQTAGSGQGGSARV